MSDNTMQLELDAAFQSGYDRGQAEVYKEAFFAIGEIISNHKRCEELIELYSMAKAGVKNE